MEWHEYIDQAMRSKQGRKVLGNRGHSMFVFWVVIRLCFESPSRNVLLKDIRASCPINESSLYRSLQSLVDGGLLQRWQSVEGGRGWTSRYAPTMKFPKEKQS